MKDEKQEERFESEITWEWTYEHEARGGLLLELGIEEPTEKEIALYILYGSKAFQRK